MKQSAATIEIPLGERLRALRAARGLSLAATAGLAGISRAALGNWETGARVPGGPALDRLLVAMGASPRVRAAILAEADPAHARIALAHEALGAPVPLGEILRALRLRRGWRQADLARGIGVTQAAVAQWEAGDRTPDVATLHAALFELGATLDETVAITMGAVNPIGPRLLDDDPVETYNRIERLPGPLREPTMLAHEHGLWWRVVHGGAGEDELARAMVQRAVWYTMMRRYDAASALFRGIHRLTPDASANPRSTGARITLTDVRLRPGPALGAARRLAGIAGALAPSAERFWAEGAQAVALATMGEGGAVAVAERAVAGAERLGDLPVEAWLRRIDLAEVHLRLDEPEAALTALGDGHIEWAYPAWADGTAPTGLAVRARALAALGREPEPELLAALRGYAAASGLPHYRQELLIVERAIGRMRRGTRDQEGA